MKIHAILTVLAISWFFVLLPKQQTYPFTLPPLPYSYNALEPYIDEQTMKLHHDKHHQGYVNELNKALAHYPAFQHQDIKTLVITWKKLPKKLRTAVRNQGGGHLNHSLFWHWMAPEGRQEPTGKLAKALVATFGSFTTFKELFSASAKKVFGSGWVWLCLDCDDNLIIQTTKNQDNPITEGLYPILGLDVWEHAYYLKYKNERLTYLDAWWHVVNWPEVERLYNDYQHHGSCTL